MQNKNTIALVIAVHKERCIVRQGSSTFTAEISGNLRYNAQSSLDYPTVGDYVETIPMDEDSVVILSVLERKSKLERQAVGKFGEGQLIAANLDFAFVTMAASQDFNLNRLDRYVSLCLSGKITPIVLLTKSDLLDPEEASVLLQKVKERQGGLTAILTSSIDENSIQKLNSLMESGKTYCFIGSSGVGKSTLLNLLLGSEEMKTSEISSSTQKGRHTTSHRELFELDNGSLVIDTPGMREVGTVEGSGGVDSAFETIQQLVPNCRFSDCTHIQDKGCAVRAALNAGDISEEEYQSYLKLKREEAHFAKDAYEKRQDDRAFGRMVREVKRHHWRHKRNKE